MSWTLSYNYIQSDMYILNVGSQTDTDFEHAADI